MHVIEIREDAHASASALSGYWLIAQNVSFVRTVRRQDEPVHQPLYGLCFDFGPATF
jgi:hypothetical protein